MCGDLARVVVKMLSTRRCARPNSGGLTRPGSGGVSIYVW